MSEKKDSNAFKNMKAFWKAKSRKFVDDYQEKSSRSTRDYIVRGADIKEVDQLSADELIAAQLQDCHYFIMTANPVESRTIKRLLYEEAKDRKIYRFWMAAECGVSLLAEPDPYSPAADHHSPRLLEINCGEEVQYYFVTIGATEQEIAKDPTRRSIKIAYICPTGTSSFTGNGSHKAIVHALRRFSNNNSGYPFVTSLGVAFGLNPSSDNQPYLTRQCLGDVLISKSIIAYDSKYKVTESQGDNTDGIAFSQCEIYPLEIGANRAFSGILDSPSCTPFQSAHQRKIVKDFEEKAQIHMDELRCHLGPLYSGGAVVSNAKFKRKLLNSTIASSNQATKDLHPIGGEMEGVGIWYACLLEDDQFPCIVIKGICDWGEEKNGWAELLEREDSLYLKEKIKEKLPEILEEQFQYEEGEIAESLIEELMKTYEQSEDERTETLSNIASKAKELGIYGESEEIQSKLKEAFEQAKSLVNDLLKDAVQAYATEQAFKMYCYMVYEDPQLGKMPAKTPNESKREREFKQLQREREEDQKELATVKEEVAGLNKELLNLRKLENEKLQNEIKMLGENATLKEELGKVMEQNKALMARYRDLEKQFEIFIREMQNGHNKDTK